MTFITDATKADAGRITSSAIMFLPRDASHKDCKWKGQSVVLYPDGKWTDYATIHDTGWCLATDSWWLGLSWSEIAPSLPGAGEIAIAWARTVALETPEKLAQRTK